MSENFVNSLGTSEGPLAKTTEDTDPTKRGDQKEKKNRGLDNFKYLLNQKKGFVNILDTFFPLIRTAFYYFPDSRLNGGRQQQQTQICLLSPD